MRPDSGPRSSLGVASFTIQKKLYSKIAKDDLRLCDEHQARTVQKGPVISNLTEVTSADVTRAVSRHRPHGLDDCDPCSGYWNRFCAVSIFKICKSYFDLTDKPLVGRFQSSPAVVVSDGTAPRWWSYSY